MYFIKIHETLTGNPAIQIHRNENRIIFKIKSGCYLKLLAPETMKLFGSTKSKTAKDKNGENVRHLEITEVVLVYCKVAINDYEQDSRVLCSFVPNRSICHLLEILTKKIQLQMLSSNFQKCWTIR